MTSTFQTASQLRGYSPRSAHGVERRGAALTSTENGTVRDRRQSRVNSSVHLYQTAPLPERLHVTGSPPPETGSRHRRPGVWSRCQAKGTPGSTTSSAHKSPGGV